MIEHMATMIVMMFLVFVFSLIIVSGMQILDARAIHASAIEQLECSYYSDSDFDHLLHGKNENWFFETNVEKTYRTRKDIMVKLNYAISLSPFYDQPIKASIVGYAR